jgi:osmotically-inducible protein OsmY
MSDEQLGQRVAYALALEPNLDASKITVAACEGVVTLSGSVSSFAQELAAVRAARGVEGVHRIGDRLQIELAPSTRRKLHAYAMRHGYTTLE